MLFRLKKRLKFRISADLCALLSHCHRPTLVLCFVTVLLSPLLLCALCAWKTVFFPTAMPSYARFLFLPAFLLLGVLPNAFCVSVLLSYPRGNTQGVLRLCLPLYTYLLLVSDLYLLLLLYRAPNVFCVLSALAMCLCGVLLYLSVSKLGITMRVCALVSMGFGGALFFLTLFSS